MSLIVQIILDNIDKINFKLIILCSMVSKDIKLKDYWHKRTYEKVINKKGICECKKRDIDTLFGCCYICLKFSNNMISATNVKKNYNLTNLDLLNLNYIYKFIKFYNVGAKYYDKIEVENYAIYKHSPKGLYNIYHKISKTKEKRINKIKELNPNICENTYMYSICFDDYIQTGKIHIKTIKERIKRYNDIKKLDDKILLNIDIKSYIRNEDNKQSHKKD